VSYDAEELRAGIVDMFDEAVGLSRYRTEFGELQTVISFRDRRRLPKKNHASAYRCEFCRSSTETHRCVSLDRVPPKGFVCAPPRPLTEIQIERVRVTNRERYRLSKKDPIPGWCYAQDQCAACGARAPNHHCFERKMAVGE
jgi:hypothetical protein